MRRFIIKRNQFSCSPKKVYKPINVTTSQNDVKEEVKPINKLPKSKKGTKDKREVIEENNIVENNNMVMMDTKSKIELATAVLSDTENMAIKKLKKDKSLIERTESSQTILTEDNRELLRG